MNRLVCVMLLLLTRTTWGVADDATKDGDVAALASGKQVEFSLITALGWVRFTASDDWAVSSMDTKKPVKTALFTISGDPNQGNATALGIILYAIDSKDASGVFSAVHDHAATGEKARLGGWEIFKSERKQGDTMYSFRTAYRDIADVHVSVKLVWPHLPKNPASFDSKMEQTLETLLKSFTGEVGSYQRRQGEQIRRPD
jgi:hypothetical protein